MRVAVTGGAGYIGSHTVVELLEQKHDVLILDNFANAAADVPARIEKIAGIRPQVAQVDITAQDDLTRALSRFAPDAVLHFAGLKAVGESVLAPLEYYRVNVGGSVCLLRAMEAVTCDRLVFSSSATVYGDPKHVPISEAHPLEPANPYGQSKRVVEKIIEDWSMAHSAVAAVNLRYFNPVGAHSTAQIGEAPQGIPNNLMPFMAQVATGQRSKLSIFGGDYDTPDGTGVRDYIHVMDLAQAHIAALDLTTCGAGVHTINIGTGQGYSVLELLRSFEAASGRIIPYEITSRRPGDIAITLADPSLSSSLLDWVATRDLGDMCRDTWAWQRRLDFPDHNT